MAMHLDEATIEVVGAPAAYEPRRQRKQQPSQDVRRLPSHKGGSCGNREHQSDSFRTGVR
jgi:hypothetical protein